MATAKSKAGITMMNKPTSTWLFEDGILTVPHLGKTVSLGRYATREFADKAAAAYFPKHSGRADLPDQYAPASDSDAAIAGGYVETLESLRIEAAACRREAVGKSARVERTLLALAERLDREAAILAAQHAADRRTGAREPCRGGSRQTGYKDKLGSESA